MIYLFLDSTKYKSKHAGIISSTELYILLSKNVGQIMLHYDYEEIVFDKRDLLSIIFIIIISLFSIIQSGFIYHIPKRFYAFEFLTFSYYQFHLSITKSSSLLYFEKFHKLNNIDLFLLWRREKHSTIQSYKS